MYFTLCADTFTHSDGKLGDGDDDSVPVVVISGPIGSGRHRFLHSLTNGTASLFR